MDCSTCLAEPIAPSTPFSRKNIAADSKLALGKDHLTQTKKLFTVLVSVFQIEDSSVDACFPYLRFLS